MLASRSISVLADFQDLNIKAANSWLRSYWNHIFAQLAARVYYNTASFYNPKTPLNKLQVWGRGYRTRLNIRRYDNESTQS